MQTQKNFVKEEIVRVAKKEFLVHGFQKASLRNIAKEVGATTGIIYTYFKNKDELFEEIVRPVMNFAEHRFKDLSDLNTFREDMTFGTKFSDDGDYFPFTSLVSNFKDELFLLMYRSSGSKLEHFVDEIIEKKTDQYCDNLTRLKDEGVTIHMELKHQYLKMPVKLIFLIIGEMVNSQMNRDEMIEYEKKAMPFLAHAWKAIL